jgi:hypothetical protein
MGIPQHTLSSQVKQAAFLAPRQLRTATDLLLDYEQGGVALNDASQGLQVQKWTGTYDTFGVNLQGDNMGSPVQVLAVTNLRTFGFTFDQQMRPFVAYETVAGNAFFYWFDTLANAFVTTQLPAGSRQPRCSLDDKRQLQQSRSDIVLAYTRGNALYFRQQRDRYGIEYQLTNALDQQLLTQVGMNIVNRFQFQLTPPP